MLKIDGSGGDIAIEICDSCGCLFSFMATLSIDFYWGRLKQDQWTYPGHVH